MAESSLTLSDEERKFLVEMLESALKETLVEEHRTRSLTYRDHIVHRENLITNLLHRLGKASG